jgi:hypothetical protein
MYVTGFLGLLFAHQSKMLSMDTALKLLRSLKVDNIEVRITSAKCTGGNTISPLIAHKDNGKFVWISDIAKTDVILPISAQIHAKIQLQCCVFVLTCPKH